VTAARPDPDACERIFHAALSAGDARGVEAALLVLAPQDPERARRLYDALAVAVRVADAAAGRADDA